MSAPSTEKVRRARRWFWIMVVTAAAAMGALYRIVKADPGPAVGLLFTLGALVLLASVTQASRIWVALEGPARLPRLHRGAPGRPRSGEGAGRQGTLSGEAPHESLAASARRQQLRYPDRYGTTA
jgi:hypothetical protein